MVLSNEQLNGITRIANLSRAFLNNDGEISQLDTLFNDPNINWAADMTQPNIDEVGSFQAYGLQAADVLAALFILKEIRAKMLTVNLPAFTSLANL